MLQKVVVVIDAHEMATATDVAHLISVIEAINYTSVARKDVCAETI